MLAFERDTSLKLYSSTGSIHVHDINVGCFHLWTTLVCFGERRTEVQSAHCTPSHAIIIMYCNRFTLISVLWNWSQLSLAFEWAHVKHMQSLDVRRHQCIWDRRTYDDSILSGSFHNWRTHTRRDSCGASSIMLKKWEYSGSWHKSHLWACSE